MRPLKQLVLPVVLLSAFCLISSLALTGCASGQEEQAPVLPVLEADVPEIPEVTVPEEPATSEPEPERPAVTPLTDKKLLIAFYPGVDDAYRSVIVSAVESEFMLTVVTTDIRHPEPDRDMRDLPAEGIMDAPLPLQYSATSLLDEIRWACDPDESYEGILGVTSQDIYSVSSSADFVFMKASGTVGVMSTARLTTDGSGTALYSSRIQKQTLLAVASILKLPKCTTEDCVRSGTATLSSMDAQNPHLCNSCIEALNNKYAE